MVKAATALILEKETEAFIESLKGAEPIYKYQPAEARRVLDSLQAKYPVKKPATTYEDRVIPVGPKGQLSLRIVRPQAIATSLPVVIYFHGAGWILGGFQTYERLVCDLAVGAQVAIVFVNYSLSPENKYPTAIEEAYAATKYIAENGHTMNLDPARLAVAGDSVGGNMTIAVTLLAKERKGPKINAQVLFYPVTNFELNSPSYQQFAEGPWLTRPAMEWFWSAYEPNFEKRKTPLMSPLLASIDNLRGLPHALVMTAEYDVLRDEGEAYAHKLMQAEIEVTALRFEGTIHDFVMLNALANTPAARGAINFACMYLKNALIKT
jgi:acetyl esterase